MPSKHVGYILVILVELKLVPLEQDLRSRKAIYQGEFSRIRPRKDKSQLQIAMIAAMICIF